MAKSIPNGKYFMGMDLGGEDTTAIYLVPIVGAQIQWARAVSLTTDDFEAFMRQREAHRRERLAKGAK